MTYVGTTAPTPVPGLKQLWRCFLFKEDKTFPSSCFCLVYVYVFCSLFGDIRSFLTQKVSFFLHRVFWSCEGLGGQASTFDSKNNEKMRPLMRPLEDH